MTLIELLVALVVVGLLSAIALPGYGAVMQRVHRNDARLALLRIQHLQERHYSTHLRYAAQFGTPADALTLASTSRSDAGHYDLFLDTASDGQHFTASAVARADGRQSSDLHCHALSVDSHGVRRSTEGAGAWYEEDTHRCWG